MTSVYKTEEGARALTARYQRLLTAWPVACEHLRVPTSQGETFVIASGDKNAPPLILLHGAGANALSGCAMWANGRSISACSRSMSSVSPD